MPQVRRTLGWALRIVGGILSLVFVALAFGAIYQAIAGNVDVTKYKPPGRLVDIGGRRLHLYCTGHGSPTVILEAGLGWGMGTWRNVQPRVAEFAQVCSYDRAGYGWSDPDPSPRTSSEVVSDLHTLLQEAGVRPPYVLVGHSIGGLYMQLYAATYPSDVSGMVLLDSLHEDQGRSPPSRLFIGVMKALGATGVARLLFRYGDPSMDAVYSSNKSYEAPFEEISVIARSADEVRGAHLSLGNKPLIVLTSGRSEADSSWRRMQLELLTHASNSKRIVVENSGHRIQNERPEAVIAAIRDAVEKSRQP